MDKRFKDLGNGYGSLIHGRSVFSCRRRGEEISPLCLGLSVTLEKRGIDTSFNKVELT
jgi:hypothetical protein